VSGTALVICGALGLEVKEVAERRGWDVDVYGVSALLHLYPDRIVAAVRERLRALRPRYRRLVVVYGDCGTFGKLEPVLDEFGAARLPGPHCYEMYAGAEAFRRLAEEQPATFFLTDWLVRNFERAVVRGLGIDRYPELKPVYFQHYTDLLYLAQAADDRLRLKAHEISAYLDLPLEVRHVGMGQLETRLAALVEAVA
jgi:SAM-dependent methyltransferase